MRHTEIVSALLATALVAACVTAGEHANAEPATATAGENVAGHSPALLARLRAGDVAALEQAVAADMLAAVSAELSSDDRALVGFDLHLDDAVCHEAPPVWTEIPPVGACLLRASALNVAASYTLIVPADGPVGFARLDMAIE